MIKMLALSITLLVIGYDWLFPLLFIACLSVSIKQGISDARKAWRDVMNG